MMKKVDNEYIAEDFLSPDEIAVLKQHLIKLAGSSRNSEIYVIEKMMRALNINLNSHE